MKVTKYTANEFFKIAYATYLSVEYLGLNEF